MKIVITHAYFLGEDKSEQTTMMPYPPLGLLYVSAYLDQNGLMNEVFDSTFETEESLSDYLLKVVPDFICVYATLMTKPQIIRLIKFIKTSNQLKSAKIILGGPDIRFNSRNYLIHGADYLVIGEGEETTLELIKALSNNEPLDAVRGIAFSGPSGDIISTQDRNLLNVDDLPFPARHKINIGSYLSKWKEFHGYNSLNINTMRGCPFGCRWCSKAVYGNSNRRRNPGLVVDEIIWMQSHYQFDYIWFVDDVFTLNTHWLSGFSNELKLRHIRISYECITRADQLSVQDIQLLKESGCYRVWIGAESGSQKILDLMNRKVKVEEVQKSIISVKKAGMQSGTFIMLGYPGEEEKDILDTVKHLKRSDPNLYTITLAYPITGTELYNQVVLRDPSENDWANRTDRQTDFSRKYPREYYEYAINLVHREMAGYRNWKEMKIVQALKHKLFAIYWRLKMKQISIYHQS
jgi:radical SAM superfamily enzyme YgiQ (UPF0313 family)